MIHWDQRESSARHQILLSALLVIIRRQISIVKRRLMIDCPPVKHHKPPSPFTKSALFTLVNHRVITESHDGQISLTLFIGLLPT